MLSADLVLELLEDVKKDEEELKESEKREKEITKKFNESMRKLSFLL